MSQPTALHKGLRVLKALRGHTLNGLSNQQLVKATGLSPSGITRIMSALIDEGLAERRDDGRFSPSVAFLQAAQQHAIEIAQAQDRINEINRRIATSTHASQ
jgi:DNA-binding IclR family transcriptional regulator